MKDIIAANQISIWQSKAKKSLNNTNSSTHTQHSKSAKRAIEICIQIQKIKIKMRSSSKLDLIVFNCIQLSIIVYLLRWLIVPIIEFVCFLLLLIRSLVSQHFYQLVGHLTIIFGFLHYLTDLILATFREVENFLELNKIFPIFFILWLHFWYEMGQSQLQRLILNIGGIHLRDHSKSNLLKLAIQLLSSQSISKLFAFIFNLLLNYSSNFFLFFELLVGCYFVRLWFGDILLLWLFHIFYFWDFMDVWTKISSITFVQKVEVEALLLMFY